MGGGPRPRLSLVPARPGAQPLGALLLLLARQPALACRARRRGRAAWPRRDPRAADELGEAAEGLAAIAFLGAMRARDDQQRALGGEAPAAQRPQAAFDIGRQRDAVPAIEATLR